MENLKLGMSNKKNNTKVGDGFTNIKGLPHALKQLLSNPAFFMLNLAGSSEGLLVAGFAAFLPKLIENQFLTTYWNKKKMFILCKIYLFIHEIVILVYIQIYLYIYIMI